MAVPSLSRLSPPMSMVRAGEAPSDLRRETTATGSVAESTWLGLGLGLGVGVGLGLGLGLGVGLGLGLGVGRGEHRAEGDGERPAPMVW